MARNHVLSFKHAIEGIWTALREEPNLKVHFIIALVVVTLAVVLNVSEVEWLILILTMGVVVSLELTNTAIEELVNSFTENEHPSAKKAKDVAAGAVLVTSITAVIIGFFIFLPYFMAKLNP